MKVVSYLATLPRKEQYTPESLKKATDKLDTLKYFAQGVTEYGDEGIIETESIYQPSDVAVILGWVHEHGKTAQHLQLRQEIVEGQRSSGGRTVIADSNLVTINNNSVTYVPNSLPPTSTVSATSDFLCSPFVGTRVFFSQFVGGSGQYQMSTDYFYDCVDAIGTTNWVDVTTNKSYLQVPEGLLYFGLRDKNNPLNVVCLAVNVICDFQPNRDIAPQ